MTELLPGLGDARSYHKRADGSIRWDADGDRDVTCGYAQSYSREWPDEYVIWLRNDGRGITFLAGRVIERHGPAI